MKTTAFRTRKSRRTAARARRVVISSLCAGLIGLAGCGEQPPTPAPEPPPVAVALAPVQYSDAAVPVRVPGVLSRTEESELAFKIGGIVEEVSVRTGEAVRAGQVLARLRLDEIDAQLAQAHSALAKAERDRQRVERLQANAVATLENLQDARTAVDVAAAQVRIAEFNRRYAVITAPADGHILRRLVEPNEVVAPGRPVLAFAADGSGWLVRAGVADADLARLTPGDRAEIVLSDHAPNTLAGRLARIAGAANPATRTTEVEILLEPGPGAARSGVAVTATLFPRPVEPRPVVPASVLIEGEGGRASVFVVAPGTAVARRQPVEIETLDGTSAYLRTRLPTDTRLVVRGGEFLRDGSKVVEAQP